MEQSPPPPATFFDTRRLALTVCGIVVLDVALALAGINANEPALRSGLLVGFLTAQVGLHALWTFLGNARASQRVASGLAAAGLVAWLVRSWGPDGLFFAIYVIQWLAVAAVLLVMWQAGFHMVGPTGGSESSIKPRQYSLRDLAVFITLTGVVAGLAVHGRRVFAGNPPRSDLVIAVLFGILFTAPTLMSLIATLAARSPVLPITLAMLAPVGLGFAVSRGRDIGLFIALFALPTSLQTAVLLLVRRRGWRFRRLRQRAPAAADVPSEVEAEPAGRDSPF